VPLNLTVLDDSKPRKLCQLRHVVSWKGPRAGLWSFHYRVSTAIPPCKS
jgi:hypothetical protein